jgi:hypothetical protein
MAEMWELDKNSKSTPRLPRGVGLADVVQNLASGLMGKDSLISTP